MSWQMREIPGFAGRQAQSLLKAGGGAQAAQAAQQKQYEEYLQKAALAWILRQKLPESLSMNLRWAYNTSIGKNINESIPANATGLGAMANKAYDAEMTIYEVAQDLKKYGKFW